jgi:hypothetical protein
MIRKEFNKHEVTQILKELQQSIPTPTDDDHEADWWNTTFARRIKNEFAQALERSIEEIDFMRLL